MRVDWSYIRGILAPRKKYLFGIAFSDIASILCIAIIPLASQRIIDSIFEIQRDPFAFFGLVAIVTVAHVGNIGFQAISSYLTQEIGIHVERLLNSRLMFTLMYGYNHDLDSTMGSISTVFQQTERIREFAFRLIPKYVYDATQLVTCSLILLWYDRAIALSVISISLIVSYVLRNLLSKYEDLERSLFAADASRMNEISETARGLKSVVLQGLEVLRIRSFRAAQERCIKAERNLGVMSRVFGSSMNLVSSGIYIVVLTIGCFKVSSGVLSIGDLFAIQFMAEKITGPILTSGDFLVKVGEVKAAMNNITTFSQEYVGARIPYEVRTFRGGSIAMEDVSIIYKAATSPALKGVSLSLPDKGVVAIVGKNGAGKSTLLNAIMGFVTPNEGRLKFGSECLTNFNIRSVRMSIGLVEQDTVLFTGTLEENIARARQVDSNAFSRAITLAGLGEKVLSKREVAEGGLNFSGGQRQKIAFARAVYKSPMVYILDEPTSFLDSQATETLIEEIFSLGKSGLVIVASHDMRISARADDIVVLDEGRVAGRGQHQDLLESCPEYSGLVGGMVAATPS